MIITKINCFLRCQNGDFLTSLFTCASVTRDDSGFARSDPLASLTYIKGLWALLLASYADEIIHTVWCFSLSCVCVFSSIKKKCICLTLFWSLVSGGNFEEPKKINVAVVITSMSPLF